MCTIKRQVVGARVNQGESGAPCWKWFCAETKELLLKRIGSTELLMEPSLVTIFFAEGNWRLVQGDREYPVFLFE